MNGECNKCDLYIGDRCLRAEKFFSSMTDPICLQKVNVLLIRDLNNLMMDYLFEDED